MIRLSTVILYQHTSGGIINVAIFSCLQYLLTRLTCMTHWYEILAHLDVIGSILSCKVSCGLGLLSILFSLVGRKDTALHN